MKKTTTTKLTFRQLFQMFVIALTFTALTFTNAMAQYCNPTMYATNPCNYLNSVTTTGALTNITVPVDAGYNNAGYSYFSSPVISQNQGASFTLTCQAAGTCNITYYFVWVDWNQDFTFSAGEMVINNGAINTANAATNFTINVPGGAAVGTTRMRILCRGIGAPIPTTACDNESAYYGETEDYAVNVIAPAPCAGIPAPGNTLSVVSVCPNVPFTLSLQNSTMGSGVTYQWQSSPTGAIYTNIAGATGSTYSATQTSATFYQCIVTCTTGPNSATSTPVQVTMNAFTTCYCTPTTINGCLLGDHITNVTFAGINNTTGTCLVNSYSDYTGMAAASATVGLSYPITVHVNNGGTEYAGAWIDYDHSGTFDVSEYISLTGVLTTDWTCSGTATIPITALSGNTRMRVRSSYNAVVASNSACSNTYSYGETEDYTVNIIPGVYDMGVQTLTAPVASACYTTTEFVTATVRNFGTGMIDLTIHPVTVNCSVTGPNPLTFTPVILNTGIINPGTGVSVSISTTYNMSATGTYVFTTSTSVSGDATAGNDAHTNTYTKSANPTVVASANTVAMCDGGSTGMSAMGTSGIGIVSYTWSPSTGLSSASSQFPLATPPSTTTYTMTVVDLVGCVATDTVLVTIHPLPAVTANASTTTPCMDADVTLTGGGANIYMWDNGVTDNVAFPVNTTNTYIVTGVDNFGCMNTASIVITPNALPIVTASAMVDPICLGSMETLNGGGAVSYVWDNGVFDNTPFASSATTTYNVTGTDGNGCEGTSSVTVTVKPLSTATQSLTICAGTSVIVGTSTYNATGVYSDIFTGANGCDSTLTTNLTVSAAIMGAQTIGVCAGGSATVGGVTHTTTGVYTDVLAGAAASGCDSTVVTTLNVDAAIITNQSLSVCAGGSITIGGNTYTTTGVYTDLLVAGAANGCDSTVVTSLTVDAAITGSQSLTICSGASVTVGSSTYNATGVYTDVFANGAANGCDSTVTTNLTVSAAVVGSQSPTVCAGGMVMVGTSMYMSTGVYSDVLIGGAASGCDSTVTTNLTVLNAITGSQTYNMCPGGSVTVGGNTYTATGVYTDVLVGASVEGCDSTVTTNLNISSSIAITQNPVICAGASITVGTNTYSTDGTYTDILTALGGCDSTVTTNLTVSAPVTGSQTLTICGGDSIIVGTTVHNTTGTFNDVLIAASGCDSTVTTFLTVNPVFLINVNSATICLGDTATLTALGATTYTWSTGATPTGVNTATASPTSTTTYTVTGTTGTCSNIGLAIVIVNPLPTVTMTAFNPPSVCANWAAFTLPSGSPTGGTYSGAGVAGTLFTPSVAGVGAHVVTYTFTDANTCSNTATQSVTVNSCAGVEEYGFGDNISIYPNPTNGQFTIGINSSLVIGHWSLVVENVIGQIVFQSTIINQQSTIDVSSLAKGIYYLQISNGKDTAVKKLVISH